MDDQQFPPAQPEAPAEPSAGDQAAAAGAAVPPPIAPPEAAAAAGAAVPPPVAPPAAAPMPPAAAPMPPAAAPMPPAAAATPPPPPVAPTPAYTWDQPAEPAGPAPGVRFAGHAGRLVAYIVDGIILGVVTTVLALVAVAVIGIGVSSTGDGSGTVSGGSVAASLLILLIVFIVSIGYFPFFWARSGSTPGMRLFRLRVVRDKDGGSIGAGTAILRLIGLWISFAVFYLGVIWILIDSRRRGWHDLLAGTVVIEEP
jgi:uncharacterized RDD family membrane protein YckC